MVSDLKAASDIDKAVSVLLRKADIDESLPTPVNQLVEAAGLLTADDYVLSESKIRQAPRALRRLLREAKRKILGVLDRRERVIHVSDTVTDQNKQRFVTCHEVSHDIFPWQRELLVLAETDKTLSVATSLLFEREANQGAAELLFQRDLLTRIARDYPVDIATVGALATMFGASFRATFRRWIETVSDAAVAGLVLDPMPATTQPATFRRFELNESQQWRDRFGTRRFPQTVSALELPFLTSLVGSWATDINTDFTLSDRDGSSRELRAQSLRTRHNTFVLIWSPTDRSSTIAKHRPVGRIVVKDRDTDHAPDLSRPTGPRRVVQPVSRKHRI